MNFEKFLVFSVYMGGSLLLIAGTILRAVRPNQGIKNVIVFGSLTLCGFLLFGFSLFKMLQFAFAPVNSPAVVTGMTPVPRTPAVAASATPVIRPATPVPVDRTEQIAQVSRQTGERLGKLDGMRDASTVRRQPTEAEIDQSKERAFIKAKESNPEIQNGPFTSTYLSAYNEGFVFYWNRYRASAFQ